MNTKNSTEICIFHSQDFWENEVERLCGVASLVTNSG